MKKSKLPKISICIPTFNRESYLEKTLQSVAEQTVKPYEVIIIDNASTDNTKEIVKKFKYKNFTYIQNKKNIGMIKNWNKALRRASGEYISLLHSDDLIAPNWYEEWQKCIQKNPSPFYTSSVVVINAKNKPTYLYHTFPESCLLKQPHVFESYWRHFSPGPPITGASVFKKDILIKTGYFNPKYQTEADVPFSIQVCANFNIYYLRKILFAYRSHNQQGFDTVVINKKLTEQVRRLKNYFSILKAFYKFLFKNNQNQIDFIRIPVFITLSTTNLYIIKMKFKKSVKYLKTVKQYFPYLLTNKENWLSFIKIQAFMAVFALLSKFVLFKERKSLLWLNN